MIRKAGLRAAAAEKLIHIGICTVIVAYGIGLSGCRPSKSGGAATAGSSGGPSAVGSNPLAARSSDTVIPEPRALDLTRPFHYAATVGEAGLAPLAFASQLARSAGGTWVVFAPKPLEDVKLNPTASQNLMTGGITVTAVLDALRTGGTPISWDTSKGYMLLEYAPQSEIVRIRATPPSETIGLLLHAESAAGLVQAVGDVWHVTVNVDPALLKRRDAFSRAVEQVRIQAAGEPNAVYQMAMARYGRYSGAGGMQSHAPLPPSIEINAVERMDVDGLLDRIGRLLGGDARVADATHWQVSPGKPGGKTAALVAQLKSVIDPEGAAGKAGFSSFAQRASGGGGDEDDSSPPGALQPIPELSQNATAAFDSLGMLGSSAVPTITAYLDPEKPNLAKEAVIVLMAMQTPEAHASVIAYAHRLMAPGGHGPAQQMRPELMAEVIRVLSGDSDPDSAKLLADTALDESASQDVRMSARMALARAGKIEPLAAAGAHQNAGPGELAFTMANPPEPGALRPIATTKPAGFITPLATTRLPSGEVWAVFLSPRLGDSDDFWLAHGRGQTWDEFLFTGQQYTRTQNYGVQEPPKPGSVTLQVNGDSVVIAPPKSSHVDELQKLQQQAQDPKIAMEQRQKIYQRLSTLTQATQGALSKSTTLSLAALRLDTDHDGLPDLVETRLGLDPKKADTDGDGVADGKDLNPLGGTVNAATDRGRLLQTIFTALFGGDRAPDPIIVILDKPYWQKFTGARARVICMTHDDYSKSAGHLVQLRTLQFGGPKDADGTILVKDGPVLFNDSHTKAQVSFWQLREQGTATEITMRMAAGADSAVGLDYLARFDKSGAWKLVDIKRLREDSAAKATTDLLNSSTSSYIGGGDVE